MVRIGLELKGVGKIWWKKLVRVYLLGTKNGRLLEQCECCFFSSSSMNCLCGILVKGMITELRANHGFASMGFSYTGSCIMHPDSWGERGRPNLCEWSWGQVTKRISDSEMLAYPHKLPYLNSPFLHSPFPSLSEVTLFRQCSTSTWCTRHHCELWKLNFCYDWQ